MRLLKHIVRRKEHVQPRKAATPVSNDPVAQPLPKEDEIELEVEREGLEEWRDNEEEFSLLDIRELYEYRQGILSGSVLIPMNDIPSAISTLDASKRWVVVCAAGMRSFSVAHYLREQGVEDAWSMVGGLGTWADQGYEHAPDGAKYGLGQKVKFKDTEGKASEGRIQSIKTKGDDFVYNIALDGSSPSQNLEILESEIS
jgi:rhodanese-related sulfurtransferase